MKPKPVVVTTICSECGLDWDDHGNNPTTSDCIRLLKVELARRPTVIHPVYPYYPYYPNWSGQVYRASVLCGQTNYGSSTIQNVGSVQYKTPAINTTAVSSTTP